MPVMPNLALGLVLVTAVTALQHEWGGVRENESYQGKAFFAVDRAKKKLTPLRVQ